MANDLIHIKLNSSEENKDNGFYALMMSGTSIVCLDDEEYIVNEEAINKLNSKEIVYELVTTKTETSSNAT